MPRVPVYDSPKVLPESLNAPLQHEAPDLTFQMERQQQFNQQVHRGLAEASHVLEGMQIEQDESDATAAHGQFISATKGILYGTQNEDGTPGQPGFLSQHGQNAVDAAPATNKALDDARNQIAEGLKTQRAKDLFLRAAGQTQRAVAGQVAEHVLNSQEQAFNNASQLREKAAGNSMGPAFNPVAGADNTAYENFRATAEAEATARAQRAGLRGEAAADYVRLQMTPYYAGVVKHLADNKQGPAAKQYLTDHRDQIADTDLRDQLQKLVDTSTNADDALNLSLTLRGSLANRKAKLDELYKAGTITREVHDGALNYAKQDVAIAQENENRAVASVVGQAQDWLLKNPGATVLDLPRPMYNYLVDKGQLGTITSFAQNGGRYVSDPETWAAVQTMDRRQLAAMTPAEFERAYRGKLDDQHLMAGIAMVKEARGQPLEGEGLSLFSNSELVTRALKGAGYLPTAGQATPVQAQTALNLENEIQRRVTVLEQTQLGGKRKATQKELQSVIDEVLLDKVFVDEVGRDPQVSIGSLDVANMSASQLKDLYVVVGKQEISIADIPAAQRQAITDSLRRRGRPVTEQAIANLWVQAGKPR